MDDTIDIIADPPAPRISRFEWRHQYDLEDEEYHGELAKTHPEGPSLTQQQFTKDADINEIMRRFGVKDGSITPAQALGLHIEPQYYGDFSDAADFRESLDRVREAEQRFATLPADIRNRFQNDPVQLYQWVSDPRNEKEAIDLKLLTPEKPAPAPTPVPAPPTG